MALNGEEGRRRVNNERVERCAAASETSLEMYVRVGVTEWKVETRRRAHEVGGRGSEHEEGPRHRFRVLQVNFYTLPPPYGRDTMCTVEGGVMRGRSSGKTAPPVPVLHPGRRGGAIKICKAGIAAKCSSDQPASRLSAPCTRAER